MTMTIQQLGTPSNIFEVAANYYRAVNIATRHGAYNELLMDLPGKSAYRNEVRYCSDRLNQCICHGELVKHVMAESLHQPTFSDWPADEQNMWLGRFQDDDWQDDDSDLRNQPDIDPEQDA